MALRPTPPAPMTTTLSPGFTLAVLIAAPTPVGTPQARRQATSDGISSPMGAVWLASTTTASAKAPQFIALTTGLPSEVVRPWASGVLPPQYIGWADAHD